ncbi:MAG: response regulator [Hydrococcus sp. Prado102]|nr:response regulator [Hydrococcus sp. Prado102]
MTRILVIEDETESREIFLDNIEEEGFDAIGAENGAVGIEKAKQHLPDLIICDILMPGLDGYGVLNALRQNPPTALTPFIFLTAKATRSEFRHGMELGADDYISKPSTIEELLGAIATQLKKRESVKKWIQQANNLPSVSAATQSIFPACPQLQDVFNFIENNYHHGITLSDVAKAVGYAPAYLTDLVRRQTGETVNRWIVKRRLAAAQSLLLQSDRAIEQIGTDFTSKLIMRTKYCQKQILNSNSIIDKQKLFLAK